MRRVSIESPHANDPLRMMEYTKLCCKDSLHNHGESPFASQLMFTAFLDDSDPIQRAWGLAASDNWRKVTDAIVFYVDHGWSSGMQRAFDLAKDRNIPIEFRSLKGEVSQVLLAKLGVL